MARSDAILPAGSAEDVLDVQDTARAFDDLARSEGPALLRYARSLLRDPEEARDLAQDALLRAYEALPTFRGEATLRTFVLRIAVHESLKRLRRRRVRERVLSLLRLGARGSADVDPAKRVDAGRMARSLEATLERLPPRQRVALTLRFFEGMSLAEIAAAMGTGQGTAKTHLWRALREVRRRWHAWSEEGSP